MLELINKYKRLIILFFLIGILGFFIKCQYSEQEEAFIVLDNEESTQQLGEQSIEITGEKKEVIIQQEVKIVPVYLCGAIKNPGVYQVDKTAILQSCIVQAGGFTEEADQNAVNLARVIIPNEKIYIPKIGEKIDKTAYSYDNSKETTGQQTLININEADVEELKLLPGIGDVKAQQIIQYRLTEGPFQSKEAIKEVTGIGEKTYSQIEQMITTE